MDIDTYGSEILSFLNRHGLDIEIFGNSAWRYLLTIVLIFIYYYFLNYAKVFIVKKIKRFESSSRFHYFFDPLSYALKRTSHLFLFAVSIRLSLMNLHINPTVDKSISIFIFLAVILQLGFWLDAAAQLLTDFWIRKSGNLTPESTVVNLVKFTVKLGVWIVLGIVFLDNLGVNVGTLITGLGIGGIAVALAVQNILGDLLCSLSIALDEPFEVGDSIVLGNVRGTVERIGIKSTRIRSVSGELIIVSNSDLVKGQIQNFKKMKERRVVFSVGVPYETSLEKLKEIPQLIKEVIDQQTHTRFDRSHLLTLGDSSLVYETVYFMLLSDFSLYAEAQQEINLQLLKRFQDLGVEFAYPTQMQYSKNIA